MYLYRMFAILTSGHCPTTRKRLRSEQTWVLVMAE